MKLKRFALRGLIILFVAVALCMFFARTVQTITTPKVQLVTASSGRFETQMHFKAQVNFPEKEEITIEKAADMPITVGRVYVKPGHFVKAGATIFTASVSDFEDKMEKLREEYTAKNKELVDLDVQNRTLSKESRQNELYDAMIKAQEDATDKIYEARFLALDFDIQLTGDVYGWTQQLGVYDEVAGEVTKAVNKAKAAQSAYETARAAYFEILDNRNLRVRDEVFNYILKRNELLEDMEELTGQMVELASTVNSLKEIVAPHDGYIVSVDVAEGDVYSGAQKAYVISREGSIPVLLADLDSESSRVIADGTRADVESDTYGSRRSEVAETVVNTDGSKQLKIVMPEDFLAEDSAAIRRFVSDGGVNVNITYRAKQSTSLLPVSAIRNKNGQDFIFTVQRKYGGFLSQTTMYVQAMNVTVLDKSDTVVAVAEEVSWQSIAVGEDRGIEDGDTVMEYQ